MLELTRFHRALARGGLGEVNAEIERSKTEDVISASFWSFLQKFTGTPEFLKDIERREKEIPQKGFGQVAIEILQNIGVEVVANAPEWVQKPGTPVLFYGNHESGLEPQLLASLCTRDDLAFVANHFVAQAGPHLREHILPVLARRYATDYGSPISKIEEATIGERTMTLEEIDKLNKSSMTDAVNRISNGWAVGIFPSPGVDVTGSWYSGVGKIVHDYQQKNAGGNLLLAPINFERPNFGDLLEAARDRYAEGVEPHKSYLEVKFGGAKSLNDLGFQNLTPEEITAKLRGDYLEEFRLT